MSKKLIFNPELYFGEGMKEIKTDKIKKIPVPFVFTVGFFPWA